MDLGDSDKADKERLKRIEDYQRRVREGRELLRELGDRPDMECGDCSG